MRVSHCALECNTLYLYDSMASPYMYISLSQWKRVHSEPGMRTCARTYRSLWKLYKLSCASPHRLPRLLPSIESTETQMHDWRRVGKPALPLDDISSPIRASLLCDIGLFLANRSTHPAGLETIAPNRAPGAHNAGATVTDSR